MAQRATSEACKAIKQSAAICAHVGQRAVKPETLQSQQKRYIFPRGSLVVLCQLTAFSGRRAPGAILGPVRDNCKTRTSRASTKRDCTGILRITSSNSRVKSKASRHACPTQGPNESSIATGQAKAAGCSDIATGDAGGNAEVGGSTASTPKELT